MTAGAQLPARPPRAETRRAADALKASLLVELAPKQRTTLQLTERLGADRQVVYRALLALQAEGKVTSFRDRRKSPLGEPGLVWSLSGASTVEIPPKDPLLWAVFGSEQRPST